MVDTVGEHRKGFRPQSLRSATEVSKGPKRTLLQKIPFGTSVAALAAALGIAGVGVATDQTPLEATKDIVSETADFLQKAGPDLARKNDKTEGLMHTFRYGTNDPEDPRIKAEKK